MFSGVCTAQSIASNIKSLGFTRGLGCTCIPKGLSRIVEEKTQPPGGLTRSLGPLRGPQPQTRQPHWHGETQLENEHTNVCKP